MSYSEAKRTHELFDDKGKEVAWIYQGDRGGALVHFLDRESADQSAKLRIAKCSRGDLIPKGAESYDKN